MKLTEQLDQQVENLRQTSAAASLRDNQQKAIDVLGSDAVRKAVDLSSVDRDTRERFSEPIAAPNERYSFRNA